MNLDQATDRLIAVMVRPPIEKDEAVKVLYDIFNHWSSEYSNHLEPLITSFLSEGKDPDDYYPTPIDISDLFYQGLFCVLTEAEWLPLKLEERIAECYPWGYFLFLRSTSIDANSQFSRGAIRKTAQYLTRDQEYHSEFVELVLQIKRVADTNGYRILF